MTVRTILLIDDSRVARLMARQHILSLFPNWEVLDAAGGEEGIAIAEKRSPDCILVDMNMPGIDGFVTAARLQKVCPKAAIAMVTANIQDQVRAQAENMGLYFLTKPLQVQRLQIYFMHAGLDQ